MSKMMKQEPISVVQFGMHDTLIECVVDDIKRKELKDLTTREQMITFLHRDVHQCRRQLAEFMDSFSQDPAHAFEWGNNMLETAQTLRHTFAWLYALCCDRSFTLSMLRDKLQQLVLREARYTVMRSTSAMANLSEDASRAALAKLYERVNDTLKAEQLKAEQRKAGTVVHT